MNEMKMIGEALTLGVPARRAITRVEIFRSNNSRELEDGINHWLENLRTDQHVRGIQYAAVAAQCGVYYSALIEYTELEALREERGK